MNTNSLLNMTTDIDMDMNADEGQNCRFIDTHSHLYDESFADDADECVRRCIEAGVTKIILPGIDIASHENMMRFHEKYDGFTFPATGLHPTSVNSDWKREIDFVLDQLKTSKYVAVGEVGLDTYWSDEFLEEQKEVFRIQIEAAASAGLPLIIHTRSATSITVEIIREMSHLGLKGVFHAYSGSLETSRILKSLGDFKFGIGGVVTFRNSSLARVVSGLSPEDILLETDSPWLTPEPYRGKRNESSYIPLIARKIAEIKGMSVQEIAMATTKNAESLFNI